MQEDEVKIGMRVEIPTQKTGGHRGLEDFLNTLSKVNIIDQKFLYVIYEYKKYFNSDYVIFQGKA